MTKGERIWELDALRGVCILGMVAVHFVYDLAEMFGLISSDYPAAFAWLKDWGGVLFLLLSGTCATLGSRPVRRGAVVFGCGLLCTAVTAGMYGLGFADKSIVIWFGVLHCLGVCMMLWPLFRRLPAWALGVLGAAMAAAGFWMRTVHVEFPWLIALGLTPKTFASSDYFPLTLNLGFFLLGAVAGRTVYARKTTRFPKVPVQNPAVRFLCGCGRQSLLIYLLHQPVLMGLLEAYTLLKP